jgi:hypothetical protein
MSVSLFFIYKKNGSFSGICRNFYLKTVTEDAVPVDKGPLEHLISRRMLPENGAFSGTLLVWGNIREGKLLFEYLFDRRDMVTNLVVTIEAGGREYDFLCCHRDHNNPMKTSGIKETAFDIRLPVNLVRVRPQVM